MAAKITNPGTASFDGDREHRSFRLGPQLIAVVEDLAMGVEAGESGLKSCTVGAMQAGSNGASEAQMAMVHAFEVPVLDAIDDYLDEVGQMLYDGFSHEEIAQTVKLWDEDVHPLALERWADRVRLAYKTKVQPARWRGSKVHEDRRRGERAMLAMRQTPEGVAHAAVLHIVYGFEDPFVRSLPVEIPAAIGRELLPLARYTDAVEVKRNEMVTAEGIRTARPCMWNDPKHRAFLEAAGEDPDEFSAAVDLKNVRARIAHADRIITSGEALRAGAAPFNEPGAPQHPGESYPAFEERRLAREDRKREHRATTSKFLHDVKMQADRMLVRASEAFDVAWRASWRSA